MQGLRERIGTTSYLSLTLKVTKTIGALVVPKLSTQECKQEKDSINTRLGAGRFFLQQ
jgi:hypothetical protein